MPPPELCNGLRKHNELQKAVQRWEKMAEHEEKMRNFNSNKTVKKKSNQTKFKRNKALKVS